jgi:allantoin racemase
MHILLVNPNTTQTVTEACANQARRIASPGTEIVAVTGEFGARIIHSRAENVIAGYAILTMIAKNMTGIDAVLLAVSYDTALMAAREMLSIPVVGITEASLLTAHLVSARFGMVTFGTPTLYRELVASHGLNSRLAGLRSIETDATAIYADPSSVEQRIVDAANSLVEQDGADCIVLTGAAMAGFGRKLRDRLPVPALDGVSCGLPMCEMLVRMHLKAPLLGSLARPAERQTSGIESALAGLLGQSRLDHDH